jgi:nicotinate dehydrogenase subunit B
VTVAVSRRRFLAAGGAIVLGFSLDPRAFAQAARLPGSLERNPMLDSWIGVAADGIVTIFTGKAELGQGIRTALAQVAADQLAVPFERIALVTADTARTPDEGYTAGSNSMKDSGTAILNACAQARELLIAEAAKRWNVGAASLTARDGAVIASDGRRLEYREIAPGVTLRSRALAESKRSTIRNAVGKSIPRVDIPGKVTGAAAYVQDLRLPGMLHGRVVRPPQHGAKLGAIDTAVAERMPGVLRVVRDGSYVAVIATQEFQAVRAARAVSDTAKWETRMPPPDIYPHLAGLASQDTVIHDRDSANLAGATIEATYHRPYQMHGSIGPSCAVAVLEGAKLTVWSHTQGVFPLRGAIAEMLGMEKEAVRIVHMEGAGCYGHNAADDAAADAALLARAMPGRPVRVQWMREEEHSWEPYGPAMVTRARAALENGRIAGWEFDVWSNTHSTRPGKAGDLGPASLLAKPFPPSVPRPLPQPEGGGDRNAIPIYSIPRAKVTSRFIPEMPLRVSALRALGAYMNVFSIESFMDELAAAARADPVEFRLRHLEDARGIEAIRTAARRFGWNEYARTPGKGRGFAFARYKNLAAYCAIAMEVEVVRESGEIRVGRIAAAVDSGEAVNPDGIRNQIEGGIVQSLSWTMLEEVTWDAHRITSRDWGRYPILRFAHVPTSIDVDVVDRPGQPFLGTGEAAQGPAAAAFANAVADATGKRIRQIPFDPPRVRAALLENR